MIALSGFDNPGKHKEHEGYYIYNYQTNMFELTEEESERRYLAWIEFLYVYLIPQNNRLMSRMTRNRIPLLTRRLRVRKGRYFSGLG